jgi:hypothetical protein
LSVLQITLPPAVGPEEYLGTNYANPVPLRFQWVAARYWLIYSIYLVRNRRCDIYFGA